MRTGIYKITNQQNQKCYIGKSKNIEQRWKEHIYEAKANSSRALCRAIRKYGEQNFSFEILEEIPIELYDSISSDREKYWIKYFNSFSDSGYNMTEGGDRGHPKGIYIGGFGDSAQATKEEVIEIRTAYQNLEPRYKVYKKYKDHISFNAFEKIWLNKSWQGIMPEVYSKENKEQHKHTKKPSNLNGAKLNKEQVLEIREKYKNQNYSQVQLAKEYGVSNSTIGKIVHYKSWVNI